VWSTWLFGWLVYSCCSHLEHRASVKRFVSLQFLNLRYSVGLLRRVISPSQGRYLTQTQNKHRLYASIGIRTHDPSVRTSEDSSCVRPCGHCDRRGAHGGMTVGKGEQQYLKKIRPILTMSTTNST
jgi:hypothetical protein